MNYTNLGVVFGPCLLVEGTNAISLSTGIYKKKDNSVQLFLISFSFR